jgi:2-methylisocitrate lyase-like PEP mutase family enzyme
MDSPVAATRPTTRLKQILQRRSATILPGTPNALIGRVIDSLEFEAMYLTGAGIANMSRRSTAAVTAIYRSSRAPMPARLSGSTGRSSARTPSSKRVPT